MQYPGCIVVAINYLNGERGVYKIGYGSLNPGPIAMKGQVFLKEDDNTSTIQFFGCTLDDDEECWFRVPSTAYASVSWQWYSHEEFQRETENHARRVR